MLDPEAIFLQRTHKRQIGLAALSVAPPFQQRPLVIRARACRHRCLLRNVTWFSDATEIRKPRAMYVTLWLSFVLRLRINLLDMRHYMPFSPQDNTTPNDALFGRSNVFAGYVIRLAACRFVPFIYRGATRKHRLSFLSLPFIFTIAGNVYLVSLVLLGNKRTLRDLSLRGLALNHLQLLSAWFFVSTRVQQSDLTLLAVVLLEGRSLYMRATQPSWSRIPCIAEQL